MDLNDTMQIGFPISWYLESIDFRLLFSGVEQAVIITDIRRGHSTVSFRTK